VPLIDEPGTVVPVTVIDDDDDVEEVVVTGPLIYRPRPFDCNRNSMFLLHE